MSRRHNQTLAGKTVLARSAKKARTKHPEKARARTALNMAVSRGTILKPSICSLCGREFKSIHIQAHHEDYSKPLDVIWLCRWCHKDYDSNKEG